MRYATDVPTTEVTPALSSQVKRLVWADSAKAFCVIMVVLGHAVLWYGVTTVTVPQPVYYAWVDFVSVLTPVRIPLFFILSGYFAKGAIRGNWHQLLRRRVASSSYFYIVWLAILTAIYTTIAPNPFLPVDYAWDNAAMQVLWPENHLWYLWALVVFVILAKAVSRVPARIVLSITFFAGTAMTIAEQSLASSLMRNFFFFLLGALVPHALEAVVRVAKWRWVLLAGLGYLTAQFLMQRVNPHWNLIPGWFAPFWMILTLIGSCAVVQGFVIITRSPWLGAIGHWVGSRTLPIYVTHLPLLIAANAVFAWAMSVSYSPLAVALMPVITTAAAVCVALGIHEVASRIPYIRWIYHYPWASVRAPFPKRR